MIIKTNVFKEETMMKKIYGIGILLTLSTLLVLGCGQKENTVRMATGGNTGTYYAYGTAIGQILGEKENLRFNIQSTGASKANIQLLDAGEVDLAIVQNDVLDYAYHGTDLFEADGPVESLRAMAGLYAEVVQIVASENSSIRSMEDLRGKRVSVGDAGSGVEFNAKQILMAYGIDFEDIQKQNLGFSASADALKDGKIDAFFATAGAPTNAIMDLMTTQKIKLLSISEEKRQSIAKAHPFYTTFTIVPGTYSGISEPVETLAVKATFIVKEDLSEELVYAMTKGLFESKEALTAASVKGQELDPAYAMEGISVPFHQGALRYFKEIGLWP